MSRDLKSYKIKRTSRDFKPIAIISQGDRTVAMGASLLFDGRSSYDPKGNDLWYRWSFEQVPIGSTVTDRGFDPIEDRALSVLFTPDKIGVYRITLDVFNGITWSDKATSVVICKASAVPFGEGLVQDAEFIWETLSDFWSRFVRDREPITTIWSSEMQLLSDVLRKSFEIDYQKSILDIQETAQAWGLFYDTKIDLVDKEFSFVMGEEFSGDSDATTGSFTVTGKGVITDSLSIKLVGNNVESDIINSDIEIFTGINKGKYSIRRTIVDKNILKIRNSENNTFLGPYFKEESSEDTLASSTGTEFVYFENGHGLSNVSVGDYLCITSSASAGYYEILSIADFNIKLDKPVPRSYDLSWKIYSPVSFKIYTQKTSDYCNTVIIPKSYNLNKLGDFGGLLSGRLITVNGQHYTIDQVKEKENNWILLTKENNIPFGIPNVSWHIPFCTIKFSGVNFEDLGSCEGDVLEVLFTNESINKKTKRRFAISAVVGDKIAVSKGIDIPDYGSTSSISDYEIRDILNSFEIETVMTDAMSTNVYTGQAKEFISYLNSRKFKSNFYGFELGGNELSVSPFMFTAEPLFIIRNRKIPIDSRIESIPLLTEYIVPPNVRRKENGDLYLVGTNRSEKKIDRIPIALTENQDFVINKTGVFYGKDLEAFEFLKIVKSNNGAFIENSITPGDKLVIFKGNLEYNFIIVSVLSNTEILLNKEVPFSDRWLDYSIETKDKGKALIKFVPGLFSPRSPCSESLWGEITYIDNRDMLEDRFGSMVNYDLDYHIEGNPQITYKSAVSAIIYSYVSGSTLETVKIGIQSFIGLPLSERDGVIVDIKDDYEINPVTGAAIKGRIVIEDVDHLGRRLGIYRRYFYPPSRSSGLGELGLGINPETGELFEVGEFVQQFTPLCKGVNVDDYITNPDWWKIMGSDIESEIKKYHKFLVRIDREVINDSNVDRVLDFIRGSKRGIRPVWDDIETSIADYFSDELELDDTITANIVLHPFYDNLGWVNTESAMQFSYMGRHATTQFVSDSNPLSCRSMFTIKDSYFITDPINPSNGVNCVYWASGGFEGASRYDEYSVSYDGPTTIVGDIIHVTQGQFSGRYEVEDVLSNTVVRVKEMGAPFSNSGSIPLPYQSKIDSFIIERVDNNPVTSGTLTANGTNRLTISDTAVFSAGVTYGDMLIIEDDSINDIYFIINMLPKRPVDIDTEISNPDTIIKVDKLVPEGSYDFRVIRRALQTSSICSGSCVFDPSLGRIITNDTVRLGEIIPGDVLTLLVENEHGMEIDVDLRIVDIEHPNIIHIDSVNVDEDVYQLLSELSTWVDSDEFPLYSSYYGCDTYEDLPYNYEPGFSGYGIEDGYGIGGFQYEINRIWTPNDSTFSFDLIKNFVPFDHNEVHLEFSDSLSIEFEGVRCHRTVIKSDISHLSSEEREDIEELINYLNPSDYVLINGVDIDIGYGNSIIPILKVYIEDDEIIIVLSRNIEPLHGETFSIKIIRGGRQHEPQYSRLY